MSDAKDTKEMESQILALVRRAGLLPSIAFKKKFQLPQGDIDLVCIQVGSQQFALYLPAVIEAIRMVKLTPLPGVSSAIVGLLNLRGQVVPVMDLRVILGMEKIEYDENTPIILFEYEGKKRALVVDAITEVFKVSQDLVYEPGESIPQNEYNLAIVRSELGLIIVLDHTKLLRFQEEQQLELRVGS